MAGLRTHAEVAARVRALAALDGGDVLRRLDAERGALLAGVRDTGLLRDTLRRLGLDEAETVAAADAALAGVLPAFGWTTLDAGSPTDWHRDPTTGERWPLVHWSRLDFRAAARLGDPRHVWEVNRCHHLVTLARAFLLTGDERYARAVWDGMASWVEANPPGFGINWSSPLEIGIRLVSWAMALDILGASGGTPGRARDVAASAWLQAEHASANLSLYASSRNNHLIGEAAGLQAAGAKFRWLTGAAAWHERGRRLVEREVPAQVSPAGVPREQALHYGVFVLEFCLVSAVSGGASADLVRRAGALSEFLGAASGSGGALPSIGDGDGGRALALSDRPDRQAQCATACAAVLAGLPEPRGVTRADLGQAAWLFGPAAVPAKRDRPGATRACASRAFADGGYFVTRGEGRHAVVDCGPLGYRSIAAHGHADCLSLVVCLDDEWVVTDPGTYCYHRERAWRDHFRSTAAHNTVTVDGDSQSRMLGPFLWGRRASANAVRWAEHEDFDLFEGTHDGYARLGVVHRRRVLFVRDGYWIVVDDLEGSGEHRIEATLQFSAATVVASGAGDGCREHEVVSAGGHRLSVKSWLPDGMDARVLEGLDAPPRGWVSSGFGEKHSSPSLAFAGTVPLPTRIAFAIAPASQDDPGARVTLAVSQPGGLAFEAESAGGRCLWLLGAVSLPDRGMEFAGALGRFCAGAARHPSGVDVTAWTESGAAVDFARVGNLLATGASGKERRRR
jgi:hypothetical protein